MRGAQDLQITESGVTHLLALGRMVTLIQSVPETMSHTLGNVTVHDLRSVTMPKAPTVPSVLEIEINNEEV